VKRRHKSAHKIAKDWLRKFKYTKIGWESSKYKDWNLTVYFLLIKTLLTKKIQFEEEKSKIKCLRTWLDFTKGLIEFMKGLVVRKIDFKSI
jgi:hypothetical protein